nr:hypothetical protein CFP56_66927 [Quercus suber]
MSIPKELDWKLTLLRKVLSPLRCAQLFFGETQNGKFNSSDICKPKHQGGICVMWRLGLSIHQMKYNKNLIALKVANALCDWLLVCIGDFNFTINDKEILRGNKRGESSATNFLKELIFEFGAIDLGFSGNTFMWAKDCFGLKLPRSEIMGVTPLWKKHGTMKLEDQLSLSFTKSKPKQG